MNYIKKAYYYLFYKLYRFSESMPSPWWSAWKASFFLDIIILIFILSTFLYYKIFIDRYIDLLSSKLTSIIYLLVIYAINYYLFNYKKKWKRIVEEFDKLPKGKNRIGSWLIFLLVSLVFVNFLFVAHLMGQIDWSQYR